MLEEIDAHVNAFVPAWVRPQVRLLVRENHWQSLPAS